MCREYSIPSYWRSLCTIHYTTIYVEKNALSLQSSYILWCFFFSLSTLLGVKSYKWIHVWTFVWGILMLSCTCECSWVSFHVCIFFVAWLNQTICQVYDSILYSFFVEFYTSITLGTLIFISSQTICL